jgi:hypothetical protein
VSAEIVQAHVLLFASTTFVDVKVLEVPQVKQLPLGRRIMFAAVLQSKQEADNGKTVQK